VHISKVSLSIPTRNNFCFSKLSLLCYHSNDVAILKTLLYDHLYPYPKNIELLEREEAISG
jgi:hypothetical protein